ncbi:MAG TPA: two-component regulator propeller domain-containing protein [Chitinophaga sp.]|uniref:ligand-binding sensor domain-containing protein n=1 Tax=Chitinophaga sp. TaxID=1869181 RepID=UPI002DB5F3B7|nr:two-component regulator propeller domain-containing protein [Chitinophaga sp.]HEU4555293.1 two-component regulator propeller domain-containing protein [Chitinophaga sp.]
MTVVAGHHVAGQSYYFKTYQVENGLSNNAVLSSLLDKKGFLWLGTADGLNRFDGYSFKVFLPDARVPGSLGNNYIHSLYEYGGMIWAGTEKGMFRMNPATEQFDHFAPSGKAAVRDIKADDKGNLWFIADFTLVKYHTATGRVQRFDPAKYFDAVTVCIATDGTVWVPTRNGKIEKYDAAHDSFTAYDLFSHSPQPISKIINKIYDTGQGFLLVGTAKQGFKKFDPLTDTYADLVRTNHDGTPIFVRDILGKDKHTYWIATESGLYVYDALTNKSHHLQKQYNNPWSLSDNAVYTLCRDHEGGMWAGTYFGGLNYCPERYTFFEKFFPIAHENSLTGNAIREIHPDPYDRLWIGTEDGGLNMLDIRTNHFSSFEPGDKPTDIANTNLHGLLLTGDTLWIGTFESGLDLFNIRTCKVMKHYTANSGPNSFTSNFIYSIYRAPGGNILLTTSNGLYQALPDRSGFTLLKDLPEVVFYTAVLQDSKGLLWAGTSRDGLYCMDTQGASRLFLKNKRINQVVEDSHTNIWITTEEGLYQYVRATGKWNCYRVEQGFPSNLMYCVLEDVQRQQLWISTSKGLVRFDPRNGQLRVYTKANGLLSDQFNYSSAYKDSCGNMYFGCVKGMIRFNPASFTENHHEPPVYFTGFQVSNRELEIGGADGILKKSIIFTDTIRLPYNKSSFSISFAALSYTAPEMTQYAYKMEGLREEWTYLSTNRKAYFTELQPGKYTFRLKAANGSGQWSGKETLLFIEVLPPFWASPLAFVIYALLAISLVWLLVRGYHRRNRERTRRRMELLEHEKEKEIYRSKIEFFTNVAHEIRNPLTLIKGPLEKALKKAAALPDMLKYLKTMERNTNRLVELSQQLLDFRQTEKEGYRLNFVRTNVSYLVKALFENFMPIAAEKKCSYTLHLPEKDLFAYLDVEAFRKIAGNLVDNALKYGVAQVSISLAMEAPANNWFLLTVENDGPLVPDNAKEKIFEPFVRLKSASGQPGSGIGLALAKSLTILHHGTLQLQITEKNTFVLRLPVHQDVEFEFKKVRYESNASFGR